MVKAQTVQLTEHNVNSVKAKAAHSGDAAALNYNKA
jgi:hypothetical protein